MAALWDRVGLSAALVLVFAGCHTMRALDPLSLHPADLPQRVWVAEPQGGRVKVDAPRIAGDTLAGFVGGEFRELVLSPGTVILAQEPARTRTTIFIALAGTATVASLMYLESRRDVGPAQVCLNTLDQRPLPYTPCCVGQDTIPC